MGYKVSVIIPVYNAEITLPRAVESVMRQTLGFENIELLLCDDCSTDGSFALIRKYAAEHPNIKALRTAKKSGAAGAPRNRGLDAATAPYILFLDADDAYAPEMVKVLFDAIQGSDHAIVSVNFNICGTSRRFMAGEEGVYISDRFIAQDSPFAYALWTKIYRTDLIRNKGLRFCEGVAAQDIVFLQTYLSFCASGLFINRALYSYTEESNSVSHCKSKFFYKSRADCFARAIEQGCAWVAAYDAACHLTDNFIDDLVCNENLTHEQLLEALFALRPLCALSARESVPLHSAQAMILRRDLAQASDERTAYDFTQLRALHAQRQRELDGIFSSTTWKIASGLQKIAPPKKAKG